MARTKRLPATILAVMATAAITACAPRVAVQGGAGPATPSAPAPKPEQIEATKVALLVPTGTANEGAASLADAIVNAARMAMADIGDPGLELAIYDTRGEPGPAADAASRAIADGAALIVGPLFGSSTGAVGGIAGPRGVNVISFSTDTSVAGGPVFVSGFTPEAEARRMVSFARARGIDSVGVFYPDNSYGRAALNGIQQAASAAGVQVTTQVGYARSFQGIQSSAGDFSDSVITSGSSGILLPDGGQGLRSVGAFMDYNEIASDQVQYMGLGQWNAKATLEEPALRNGWFPAPDPGAMRSFVRDYRSSYGSVPQPLAVLGYDAIQVAAQLLKGARASGEPAFDARAITRPQGFDGAVGPLRFRSDGTADRAMAILEVGDGVFDVVDPAPAVFGPGS